MMLCYTSITLQYVNVDVKPKIVSAHKRRWGSMVGSTTHDQKGEHGGDIKEPEGV